MSSKVLLRVGEKMAVILMFPPCQRCYIICEICPNTAEKKPAVACHDHLAYKYFKVHSISFISLFKF
jgi:hypothetical protein